MSLSIVSQPRVIDFARNPLFFRLVSSTDGNSYDDYHIRAKIFVENLSNPGTYFELPEFRLDPYSDGTVELYDIGNVIRRKFQGYFDLPDFEMSGPVKTLATVIQYNVTFTEMDGDNEIGSINSGNLLAINGKINLTDYPGFDLRTFLNYNKKFLTNSPERIYTYHGSKHYLYYINTESDAITVIFKIQLHTKSGVNNYESDNVVLQQYQGTLFPVGDVIATYGNEIIYATVWLETINGTILAGPKNYFFRNKTLYAKTFIFQNRFGVFDTINTFSQENNVTTERSNSLKNLTPGFRRLDGNVSSELISLVDTFEAETGVIPIANAQHYKELIESEAVFLQSEDRWIRVIIDAGSFKITDEGDDLQNVAFSYRAAYSGDMLNSEIKLPQPEHEDYSSEYLKTDYQ
ncbi:hypothetical protein ACT29H_09420 [Thermophagus sp. OGC60D27]|uniref:hypothetical protein n=1 Tax=Thermophagus sp. OGC60D27 TaxID=3458415 RepID=UPI004037EBEF